MKKSFLCALILSTLFGCGEVATVEAPFSSNIDPKASLKISELVAQNGLGKIFKISDTPLNLYEVISEKGVFYVDSSMQYAIKGTITSIKTGKNHTAEAEAFQLSKVAMQNAKTATISLSNLVSSTPALNHYKTPAPVSTYLNSNQIPKSSLPVAPEETDTANIKNLGDSLIKHIKDDRKPLPENLYLGTVEGQEAMKKARKAMLDGANQARQKRLHRLPEDAPSTEPKITKDGKKALPKVGYDYDGNPLPADITKEQVQKLVSRLDDTWVTFYRAKEEKTIIGVFTSYTCPICRNLHNSIKELNAEGVTVAYLQYPRTRRKSEVKNMSYAWCSSDQQSAYDKLYENQYISKASCDDLSDEIKAKRHPSPIPQHVWMGKLLDIKGTPTIITKGGKILSGFSNVDILLDQIADEL